MKTDSGPEGRPDWLLERAGEVDALSNALDKAAGGKGSLVVIEGPAGIGKTSLLRAGAEIARAKNFRVLTARSGEIEKDVPFGVARQLFERVIERAPDEERDRLLSGAARLSLLAVGPFRSSGEELNDPFAPVHGLYWVTANLSEPQAIFICIDDLQWCDRETLRFVEYLSRRMADLHVLVVGTLRTGEPVSGPEITDLRKEATVLQPSPLTQGGVDELILAQQGSPPTRTFSDSCFDSTKGNPFLVREIIRGLASEQLQPNDEAARVIEGFVPESVAHNILVRVGRFGEEAVALARAISILGEHAQLRHAADVAGMSEDRATLLCDRLQQAEILSTGVPIRFVHPLVRQAIYAEQSESERADAHRRVAEILDAQGIDPQAIAPHLVACPPGGDQWVVERLREAARQGRAEGAHDKAIGYLERALAEPPTDDFEDRYWLARALHNTDPGRAVGVFVDLTERAEERPDLRLDALRWAAVASFTSGDIGAGLQWSLQALEAVPSRDRERRLLLEAQAFVFDLAQNGISAVSQNRIERVADGLKGATTGELVVMQAVATGWFLACAPVGNVIEMASRFPRDPWEAEGIRIFVPAFAAKVLTWSGRWDLSRWANSQLVDLCHSTGQMHAECWAHAFLSEVEWRAGRFKEAEVEANLGIEIAGGLGSFSLSSWYAKVNLLGTMIKRGQIEKAQDLADQLPMDLGPREVRMLNPWPLELRGYLRIEQEDLSGAIEDLTLFGDACDAIDFGNPAVSPWWQEAAGALVTLGRTHEAEEIIGRIEERALRFGAPHVLGLLMRCQARFYPRKRQIDTLRRSVEVLESSGPPYELARSCFDLGAALRRAGSRSEARPHLATAMDIAHRCGADGLAGRAREELIAAGARPRRQLVTGPGSLTAAEQRVARLATEGLSNRDIAQRLFLTLRTVETHLTHVYDKLQISGRPELPAALEEPRRD